MYLISVYFDEQTNKKIQRLIDQIAIKTGNTFMIDNHVPPHMTISSVEARNTDAILPHMKHLQGSIRQGELQFVSVGMFFPYVMYLTPVLNEYLQIVSQKVYKSVSDLKDVTVSRYYKPTQWLPHITLGKTLSKEQMKIAFEIVQQGFVPFEGQVTTIGLAKPNPHEDILLISL